MLGSGLGSVLGSGDGRCTIKDGLLLGAWVGMCEGNEEPDGETVGDNDGETEGIGVRDGSKVGTLDGPEVGLNDMVGNIAGEGVGGERVSRNIVIQAPPRLLPRVFEYPGVPTVSSIMVFSRFKSRQASAKP